MTYQSAVTIELQSVPVCFTHWVLLQHQMVETGLTGLYWLYQQLWMLEAASKELSEKEGIAEKEKIA